MAERRARKLVAGAGFRFGRVAGLCGLVWLFSSAPTYAGAPAKPTTSPAPVDGFARKSLEVTPRVHLIYRPVATHAPFEGNTTVIEQADGLVVIDAGGSPVAGRHIVNQIRAFSKKPVKALIYTHYHGDHNLGAGALLEAWPGLTLISTQKTRDHMLGKPMEYIKTYDKSYQGMVDFGRQQLESPQLSDSERRGWAQFVEAGPSMVAGYAGLKPYPAQVTFTDRLTLHDPDAPLEIFFPGRANTDGDLVAWLPKQRVLVTGDIVVHPIPYASACFISEWIDVLTRLKAFDFAHLIPGHGEVQTDRAYLDRLITALTEVRAQVTPLVKQGRTLDEVRQQIDLQKVRAPFVGNDPWGRFFMNAVFAGDIVRNAYQEAKGEPILQGGGS